MVEPVDKTRCPQCGGPVEQIVTSIGTGYYCPGEDRFIGEYYDGPSWKEIEEDLRRKWNRLFLAAAIPFVVTVAWILWVILRLAGVF